MVAKKRQRRPKGTRRGKRAGVNKAGAGAPPAQQQAQPAVAPTPKFPPRPPKPQTPAPGAGNTRAQRSYHRGWIGAVVVVGIVIVVLTAGYFLLPSQSHEASTPSTTAATPQVVVPQTTPACAGGGKLVLAANESSPRLVVPPNCTINYTWTKRDTRGCGPAFTARGDSGETVVARWLAGECVKAYLHDATGGVVFSAMKKPVTISYDFVPYYPPKI